MNKAIISVLVVFFVGLAASQPANAAINPEYGYQIEVSDTSFLPSTIYAGDIINMEVGIKNRASNIQLVDLEAEITLGGQFEGIKTVDSIDSINAGETKTLVFQFQAKVGTSSGQYSVPLTMLYLSNKDLLKQTHIVFVPITKAEKNLDITIDPNVVNPGKPTEVIFTIKNVGNTPVSNISLSWAEENNLVLPIGSDNKRYVNVLSANQKAEVSYLVTADPNITPGVYPLDISITFNDINATRTQVSHIGLIIGGKTDFEISAELMTNNQLSISIANIGSNNADAVVVKIPSQQNIAVNGSNIAILGNLNKGDYTLANFEVIQRAMQMRPGVGDLPSGRTGAGGDAASTDQTETTQESDRGIVIIQVDYTDTTGQRQSIEKKLEMTLTFSETTDTTTTGFADRMRSRQSTDLSTVAWALLVVIIVGAAAFNRFKAGNSNWKRLGKALAIVAVLFITAIFLFGSSAIAIALAAVVSLLLLGRLFRQKHVLKLFEKAAKFIEKHKE